MKYGIPYSVGTNSKFQIPNKFQILNYKNMTKKKKALFITIATIVAILIILFVTRSGQQIIVYSLESMGKAEQCGAYNYLDFDSDGRSFASEFKCACDGKLIGYKCIGKCGECKCFETPYDMKTDKQGAKIEVACPYKGPYQTWTSQAKL